MNERCGYLNKDDSCNFTLRCKIKGKENCTARESNKNNVLEKILRNLEEAVSLLQELVKE